MAPPVEQFLGHGRFGGVYYCIHPITEEPMADKRIDIQDGTTTELETFENEVRIMQSLSHPHIVILSGLMQEDSILHIYMEYMAGGNLAKQITAHQNGNTRFEERRVISYVAQVLSAVGYMHKQNFIHRDLNPKNILLSEDKELLKVADFGVSKACETLASKCMTFAGTVAYMAPEVAEGKPYEHKCDIWSLGVIAYEMLELKLPINTQQRGSIPAMLEKIKKGEIEPMQSRCAAALREVTMSMLKKDTDRRPECSALLQKDIFDGIPDISSLRIEVSSLSMEEPGAQANSEAKIAQVWQAAYDGDLVRLQQLLDGRSDESRLMDGLLTTDTDLKRTTPTMAAAYRGHKHVIAWIISNNKAHLDKRGTIQGCGRDIGGMTALLLACERGHLSVVDTLIDDGRADGGARDEEGGTAIMWAGGHCDVVRSLIKRGHKVGDRRKNGNTALHCAAYQGQVACIELLISEGAEVNADSKHKNTPLYYAAWGGHPSAILSLLQHGANMEARSYQQRTPLCMAALCGHESVLRLLLEKGADIHVRGFQQSTLLHYAAQGGHVSALSFLLSAGCDVTARDQFGRTPQAVAEAFHHPEAAGVLVGVLACP